MNRSLALASLAALVLSGCTRPPEAGDAAARRCDDPNAGRDVYIEVSYASDRMPDVTPRDCSVDPGTRVEWRGPDGDPQAFGIRFKNANPIPRAPQGRLHSNADHARQVAWGSVDAAKGRYDYTISAGSQERDPAIIIR